MIQKKKAIKMTSKLRKIVYHKLVLNDIIEKTNQNLTKNPRTKIKKKNKDGIQNLNKLEGNTEILHGYQDFERRREKREDGNKISSALYCHTKATTCRHNRKMMVLHF
jgi:hypothetical protein